jgi:hypothetical protein
MNANYLEIEDKYYAIDMDKAIEFISKDGNSTQTINQNYGIPINDNGKIGTEIKLISKELSETKEPISENMSNIRFSMLTFLLNTLMAPLSDGTGNVIVIESLKTLHFGQLLAFNTLFEMGIIYEIDNED